MAVEIIGMAGTKDVLVPAGLAAQGKSPEAGESAGYVPDHCRIRDPAETVPAGGRDA